MHDAATAATAATKTGAPPASRSALTLFALTFFELTLLQSALGTVLPQLFFQRAYPDRKVFLLAICLLTGTVASILGVAASNAVHGRGRWAVLGLGLTSASFLALFHVQDLVPYIALTAVVRFGLNYLINRFDHASVVRAGAAGRDFNDRLANIARLLGHLSAPLFFATFYDAERVIVVVVGCATIAALVSATRLLAGIPAATDETPKEAAPGSRAVPLSLRDRLYFGYAMTVQASMYLFAANLIYLARDVLHIPSPERAGSSLIVIVFFSSLVVIAGAPVARRLLRIARPGEIHRLPLLLPAATLGLAALALGAGFRVGFGGLCAGGVVIGMTYGAFLLETRDYSSAGARNYGRQSLVSLFNNIGNISSLVAFGILSALAAVRATSSASAMFLVLVAVIGLLPIAGVPFLMLAARPDRGAASRGA